MIRLFHNIFEKMRNENMNKVIVSNYFGFAVRTDPGQRIHCGLIEIMTGNKQKFGGHGITSLPNYTGRYSIIQ